MMVIVVVVIIFDLQQFLAFRFMDGVRRGCGGGSDGVVALNKRSEPRKKTASHFILLYTFVSLSLSWLHTFSSLSPANRHTNCEKVSSRYTKRGRRLY